MIAKGKKIVGALKPVFCVLSCGVRFQPCFISITAKFGKGSELSEFETFLL